MLSKFFKDLEQWERYELLSFWLCSICLYISFSGGFVALFPESHRQSHVVIEQVEQIRGGGKEDYPFLGKRKKFDLDFHRQLEQYFSDWTGRMNYQKKQEKFFKSAMLKKREMIRLRMKEDPKFYTKEELDTRDYFQGNGIYAKYQDKREKYNIFDTRQSFLLKMHDDKLRNYLKLENKFSNTSFNKH